MSHRILIIEDEPNIAHNIQFALQLEGLQNHCCALGLEGIEELKANISTYDLVILDVGLPDVSGFEVCKLIRTFSEIPIIFLTARSSEIDRVVGLEIGADDYVIKPFSPRELVARVKVRIKRSITNTAPIAQKPTPSSSNWFYLDSDKHVICFLDQPLNLTSYEFGILKLMLNQPDRVFSREQIMTSVWTEPESSFDRVIDTHIKSIRAKLKSISTDHAPIITHRGLGYSIKREA